MAVKGITIEISGNTTKLETALKNVKAQGKNVESSLKNVNKALKFNPNNTELLTQKLTLLKERIQTTKDRLEAFKAAQKSMDADGVDKTSKEYMEVRRNIIECESKLKTFNAELKRTQAAVSVVGQLGTNFQDTGKKIKEAGRNFKYISIAAGLAFRKSAMDTAEFEKSLAKVSTISDETQVPVKQLGKEILKLSNTYGLSSTELSEATYQALSASIQTKDVAEFVETSAKLAKTGFLETNEAVDVLTTTINAYGYKAKDAGAISDKLIEIQNRGKTTVKELSENLGQVIPTAAALGVNFDNLGASYIVMTKKGINAANATTYTRAMLNELSKDGSRASQILREKTGKSFSELMKSGKSLGDVLNILYDATGKNGTEFKNLWGNVRAGSGALALVQGDANAFNEALGQIKGSTGNVDRALKKMQTVGVSFNKIFNALKNIMVIVTGALAEKLAPAISFVSDKMTSFANAITDLQGKHDGLLAALGAILPILAAIAPALLIAGTLIEKFGIALSTIAKIAPGFSGALGKAFGFLKANPIILVVAALAALALMISKTGMSAEELSGKIAGFVNSAVNVITGIISQLPTILNAIISGLIAMLPALVNGAVTLFMALVQAIPQIIPPLINAIVQLVNALVAQLPTLIPLLINGAISLFMALVQAIPQILPLLIAAFIQLIIIFAGQLPTLIPVLLNAAIMLFMAIVQAVPQIIVALVQALPQILAAIIQGLAPIGGIVGGIFNAVKQTIIDVWNNIKQSISDLISSIKGAISDKFNEIKSTASSIWEGIKSAIVSPVESALSKVKEVISKLKAAFKFKWKLPDLKLPHIKIIGKFSLKPPKAPHFSLKWYKEGGIFDKPTIAGIGEAGSEAVLPTHKLDKFLSDAVNRVGGEQNGEMLNILVRILNKLENAENGETIINQTINFNKPYESPIDVARALKRQAIETGMAGQL